MSGLIESVRAVLGGLKLSDGRSLVEADLVRALTVEDGAVRFVLEAETADAAPALVPLRDRAEAEIGALAGVTQVSVVLTAPAAPQAPKAPPRIGGHPTGNGSIRPAQVDRIVAVASGKGGVGKSTVSANLAVALARQGRRVGLLDADIYGPSQPQMMGATGRPGTGPDDTIVPLKAHGVTLMSIGFMVDPGAAIVWRGPMLMGALQQMMSQVAWGELDVLIVDLPPGTGDVQLTLCQRAGITGALVVSTPQDVALLDARRAIDMFDRLKTPVLGLVENMSMYVCPKCGHEAHLFGHGGVAAEAESLGLPFLAELPLALEVRQGGDAGRPVALGDDALGQAYAQLARRMIDGGMG